MQPQNISLRKSYHPKQEYSQTHWLADGYVVFALNVHVVI